jgi:hypothetical protein
MKWITTDKQLPAINEIIIYKGNLMGIEGRHMSNGFAQLKNGDIDQFDEWKPVHPGFVTMKVQHPEKRLKVEAKGRIVDNCFDGEFKDGITYGVNVPL